MRYYAVLTYQHVPNPNNFPPLWPAEYILLPEDDLSIPNGEGWSLLSEDQLANLVQDLTPAYLQKQALIPPDLEFIVKVRIKAAMDAGRDMMADYGTTNTLRGLNEDQVEAISDRLAKLQALVLSGSLRVAYVNHVRLMTPYTDPRWPTVELIRASDILFFKNRLEAFLGLPLSAS
jgi:hypothetical protein